MDGPIRRPMRGSAALMAFLEAFGVTILEPSAIAALVAVAIAVVVVAYRWMFAHESCSAKAVATAANCTARRRNATRSSAAR